MNINKQKDIKKYELKPFVNGYLKVYNVPYTTHTYSSNDKDYLTYNVLFQLSNILEYMVSNDIFEVDYQKYITNNKIHNKQQSNVVKIPNVNESDIDKIIKMVIDIWLDNHYAIKLQSNEKENRKWIDTLYGSIDKLPELHQNIIKYKYLEVDFEGKYPLDENVYEKLHISRRAYYVKKKEALYWLGLSLFSRKDIDNYK